MQIPPIPPKFKAPRQEDFVDVLSLPWIGSFEQRLAWRLRKDHERRAHIAENRRNRRASLRAEKRQRCTESERQEARRKQTEAIQRAELAVQASRGPR